VPDALDGRTSQVPVSRWHEQIGDPTLADGILDRLVHNAHRIETRADSMRKTHGEAERIGNRGVGKGSAIRLVSRTARRNQAAGELNEPTHFALPNTVCHARADASSGNQLASVFAPKKVP
jgi:IstB-like ATP binding protein